MHRTISSGFYQTLVCKVRGLPSAFLVFVLAWFSPLATAAEVDSIRLSSLLDPNAILITEVDVVFVYDQALADEFPSTKAQWFSGKFMYSRGMGDRAEIVNTFVPQGFDHLDLSLPSRVSEAVKIYVIAQHDDSKTKPAEISKLKQVLVEIDQFGILVSEQLLD